MSAATSSPAARFACAAAGLLALVQPDRAAGATPAILQELRTLRTVGTVLHVGAHPDDENTELITWLSRGRGYRTGYLSITRGDGGQNELGPEFGEKLGLARTQELLAARRLDGGRQFFTRAIDFGYSKSPEETLRFWDHDAVLGDVVRVIRKFRPDVIITRFPIPPGSGGHGQHTASAILAVEAFKLAGDPQAYPEQLKEGLIPWQPKRVLWNSWQGRTGPLNFPTFEQDIAGNDPVTGEAFGAIAALSRSQHQTQGLAGAVNRARNGANVQTFMRLAGETPASDLMDGVDPTWARVPGGAALVPLLDEVITKFNATDPAASVPALFTIRAKLDSLNPADPLVKEKHRDLDRIIAACLGIRVRTVTDRKDVVPGEEIIFSPHSSALVPLRWTFRVGARVAEPVPLLSETWLPAGPGNLHHIRIFERVPNDQPLTQPYWLRADGTAGISRVDDPKLIGLPENPPALPVRHYFALGDQVIAIDGEIVCSSKDETGAESTRPVQIVPPVSLQFGSEVYVAAPGSSKTVEVEVSAARANTAGTLRLETPAGWKISPAAHDFKFANAGDTARFAFQVTAPGQATAARLTATAEVGGRSWSNQRIELNYSHLPPQLLQPPARAQLVVTDVAIKSRIVGYLPGAGDSIAEALVQLGCEVVTLTGADLSPAKLAGLDAVVIGVRAFNDRTDLAASLPGLFEWVETGGTVITQYNRPNGLKATQLGPYPLSIEGPAPALRVTDETAPVTFLAPDHPALNRPNKITAADFEGWVQERGTYFPSKWDEAHYTPILAMSDPGEAPLKSSLLIAPHGKGWYVYAGVAFFRQLPAGNPGAHRLFANLVSLGK